MKLRMFVAAGLLGCTALLAAEAHEYRVHFDSDFPGSAPVWMRFESDPGNTTSRWVCGPDELAVSTPNVLRQGDKRGAPGQFRFGLSTEAKEFRDGSVQISLLPKQTPRGARAGVVLRYRNPKNYLAALYDFTDNSVTVFRMHDGVRKDLGTGRMASIERSWTTLTLSARGHDLEVRVSNRPVFTAKDPEDGKGAAGLVAEGAVQMAFDELVIRVE